MTTYQVFCKPFSRDVRASEIRRFHRWRLIKFVLLPFVGLSFGSFMATYLFSNAEAGPETAWGSIRPIAVLTMTLFLFAPLPASRAQDSSKASDADSAAIKQTFTDFYESFSHHDAHATAMTFAEDADFTNMRGIHRHGREEIEAWFANLFKGNLKSSNRTDIVRSIRFFTPQVATVDADTVITGTKMADGSEGPPRKGLMIATLTKQNGRWLISVFHEAEFPEPAATANRLTK